MFSSPLMLGFDRFEQIFERIIKITTDGYPPYNIEQIGAYDLRISMAVAGFAVHELSVEIMANQLTIRGRKVESQERSYLYRGIAVRQFVKCFVIAEGIKVNCANMQNGLLHIDLTHPEPENTVQIIPISDLSSKLAQTAVTPVSKAPSTLEEAKTIAGQQQKLR